ncbi:hypothetical protein ACS0TY_011069 [Phlomoides rotata]
MALRALLMSMIVATALAPALASDYMVGGNPGWNSGVNFTSWALKYDFHVGDSLMFMYTPKTHNVIKVNASEFKTCTYSNDTSKIFTSGSDTIPLAGTGKKWYISGVGKDCGAGMKLVITVSAADGPSPAPMPGSSTPPPGTSAAGALKSCVWMVAVMVAYMIMAA